MEFSTQTTLSPHQIKTAALGLGVYADGTLSTAGQALDRAAGGLVSATIKTDFDGAAGATLVLRHLPGIKAERVILVGLGKADQYSPEVHARAELAFAQACVQARVEEAVSELAALPCENSTLHQRAQRAATSYGRALYRYTATFGKPDAEAAPRLNRVTLLVARSHAAEAQKGLKEGRAIANGMDLTRTLGNLPGNICTPRYLADTARKLAKEFKSIKVEVLDQKEIQALGMGSFLSVAKGSDEPPRFIILRHQGKKTGKGSDKAPHVLVGKGITFDSGGISIKPAATMDEMKYDMCGAASVLGTFRALGELDLPLNVVGLIAACENLPSGRANKPGDVVTSMSGQTIEILNTDAEGRLVLCDALTYAERLKPASVVDIATLTGACVVALGHVNSGLFSTDQALADSLQAAGRVSLDTVWQLPIQDAYQEQLKSRFADIANIGGPAAGSVTAACFLSRFTKAYRWAHLDIAGTAWQSGKDKGATGRPVPLLTQYLLDQVR
ncbi:MAG: leucyl aminopeptidase [Corticimicrobacter sp.]|uniref:leucyl aminopeptidase n=1 Tax=Corticimicrobacter sp. TaxID=2678536 RepID=UPI0032DB82C9